MPEPAYRGVIAVVRGRFEEVLADPVLRFWVREGALDEEEGRRRLADVVCVLLDENGEVAGVNSVYPADIDVLSGRRFWIYRSFISPEATAAAPEMERAAFGALEAEFDPHGDGPIGLCLLISDPAEMALRPEAESFYPHTIYAGYTEDGSQVRIMYFTLARITRRAAGG